MKGAGRWIVIFGINLQPSEFLKPAFVILIAWLFGEFRAAAGNAGQHHGAAMLLFVVTLLVLQPDFGQTMLIVLVWGALFFMAGMRMVWVTGLGGAAAAGLAGAYLMVPHVARRIKRFLDPASGDTFQIDNAVESFLRGGWFGRGPGEGTVKRVCPTATPTSYSPSRRRSSASCSASSLSPVCLHRHPRSAAGLAHRRSFHSLRGGGYCDPVPAHQ